MENVKGAKEPEELFCIHPTLAAPDEQRPTLADERLFPDSINYRHDFIRSLRDTHLRVDEVAGQVFKFVERQRAGVGCDDFADRSKLK